MFYSWFQGCSVVATSVILLPPLPVVLFYMLCPFLIKLRTTQKALLLKSCLYVNETKLVEL